MTHTLLTGASSGIGLEMAKILAAKKHNLIIVARSLDKLESLKNELKQKHDIDIVVIQKDLAQPGSAQELYNDVREKNLHVDTLINNAGFSQQDAFKDIPLQREQDMMQLNMVTLVELTKLFLPHMLEKKKGNILNVASTAAYLPGPYMAVYYASKAFVRNFSEAVATELQGTGVTVTALCPGITQTGFQKEAGAQHLTRGGAPSIDAIEVARQAIEGIESGRRIVIPGILNQFMMFATRLLPRKFMASFAGKFNRGK